MGSHGVTSNTTNRLLFGAGVWIRNYDVTKTPAQNLAIAESIIGASAGGNKFTIEQEFAHPEVDGILGKLKGAERLVTDTAKVEGTFVEIDLDLILDLLPGATSAALGNGVMKLTRTADVASADYLTSIGLVCDHAASNGSVGFVILNPLQLEPVVFEPTDKSFGTLAMSMEAHYDPAAMTTCPWNLLWPGDALVS